MAQISFRWRNFPDRAEQEKFDNRQAAIFAELRKSGKRIIDLEPGDLSRYKEDGFENTVADEHLAQAAREGWGMYPSETVPPEKVGSKDDIRYKLRESICHFLKKYRGVDCTPEHMFVGHGVSGCFSILNNVLLDPGDEVVNIEPSHFHVTEGLGGVPIFGGKVMYSSSDANNRWEPDLDDLRSKISRRTKYIIIDHPQNPCAVVYSDKTLKEIVDIAGEHDLPLIVDEMYQLISFDGIRAKSVASFAGDVPVIIMESTSKFWMKPAWCLGYAAFHDPEGKIAEIEKTAMRLAFYQGFGYSRIPTPIMVAAMRTFVDPKAIELGFKAVKTVEERRNFTYKRLNEISGLSMQVKPQATLYGLFRVDEIGRSDSRWPSDKEFVLDVLKEEGLLFNAGTFWGKSAFGHVRTLLYRNIEVLTEAYDKLERFMTK